jgi:hypothetical protein
MFSTLTSLFGQKDFEVPKSIELKTKEDFAKYENDIVEAAKWLEATDLNKEKEKHQEVNAFVIQWISGSPDISINITSKLGDIYGENPPLLLLYMASYARHFIENKNTATKQSGIKAGILSIINTYKKGIEIKKSNEMDKVIKLTAKNKLDEYIKDNFK